MVINSIALVDPAPDDILPPPTKPLVLFEATLVFNDPLAVIKSPKSY